VRVSDNLTEDSIDWHFMLLGLAGRLDDTAVAQCRDLLADGQLAQLGTSVLAAVVDGAVPMFETEIDVLSSLMVEAGAEQPDFSQVSVTSVGSELQYMFAATRGPDPNSAGDPRAGGTAADAEDGVDAAAIAAVSDATDVVGIWRAWRVPEQDSAHEPRRVYVVEVGEDADMIAITATIQGALRAAGEVDPQVEVYPQESDLPTYHRFARAYGELIWSRTPDPGVQIAAVFDEVDPTVGPRFTPDHPVVDGDEVPKLLDYLRGGEGLLLTTARLDDVVEPERGNAVPMSFRTDGAWVWSDATTYYLDAYRLLPDPALVAHIRTADYVCPPVDGPGRYRAMAALQAPAEEEPAWVYGQS
jgi:hypothetical protein